MGGGTSKHVRVDHQSEIALQKQEILRMSKNISNTHLTKQQDSLLRKMIAFDSLELGFEADKLKSELYRLFFVWQASTQQQKELGIDEAGNALAQDAEQPIKYDPRRDEEERQKKEDEKEELRKKAQLKRDQDLIEFEERGGFVRVLRDIFNPVDKAAMQLDSVYQLKNMCKNFYTRKQLVNEDLIQTLDALANERPTTL